MNDTTKPLPNPAHEGEWQAQERAVLAERTHAAADADDARSREYRLIARALSEAPADTLPEDFATSVAQRALANQRAAMSDVESFTSPFERRLLQLLVAVFGVAIGAVVVFLGGETLQSIGSSVLAMSAYAQNPWVLALAACLALSAGGQLWRPRER
jgi:hypothetical protein